MREFLIGIDDTDNQESRGTGFLSRLLARHIEDNGLGKVTSISRHQLFIHPRIPYTSQNSSACLLLTAADLHPLRSACINFILEHSAGGSDPGIAIAPFDEIPEEVIRFGQKTKSDVMRISEAKVMADSGNIFLKSLAGSGEGIIGALAAVGLRKSGSDGRCIWLQGLSLRELSGVYRIGEIQTRTGIDAIVDIHGGKVSPWDRVEIGDWARPVIRDHRILLPAVRETNNIDHEWKVASKEYIQTISA
jgi:hypothetical protein